MDGQIYITISEEPLGEGGKNGEGESGGTKTTKKERALNAISHQALHFVLNEAKTAVNYSVSHIGVRTGDYVAQHNAQVAMNLAYKGVGIGFSAYAGVKAGGIWGAAIGVGIGVLTTSTNIAHQWFDLQRQLRIQNREIEMLRQRAGLDINNGSR